MKYLFLLLLASCASVSDYNDKCLEQMDGEACYKIGNSITSYDDDQSGISNRNYNSSYWYLLGCDRNNAPSCYEYSYFLQSIGQEEESKPFMEKSCALGLKEACDKL